MAYPFARLPPGSVQAKAKPWVQWSKPDRWQGMRSGPRPYGRFGAGGGSPPESPQKVLFAPLEPRFLLSADLMPIMVDMADDGHDLTLKLDLNT